MKKLTMICMAALLMLAVSCKKDKKDEIENAGSGFRATVESHEGTDKTHLEGVAVKWDSGDVILVKSSTCTTPKGFTTTGSGATVNFDANETLPTNFYAPPYTGYYPASAFEGDQLTLPPTQQYDENNTFASGANPMAATSDGTLLPFKNVCGVLKLQLYSATPCKVRSISITSNAGEQLCGTGTVTLSGGIPSLGTLTGGGSTLTLDMGEGGKTMSISESAPTAYYFVVPANTLGTSFTVKVTDTDGKVWTKTANASQNLIARSKITKMPKTQVNEMHTPVIPTVTTIVGCVDCTHTFSGNVTVSVTHLCEYGFVYAKTADNSDPTIGGTGCVKFTVNTENLSGSKDFTADLVGMGLEQDVEYTVRAYGICDEEGYGDKLTYVYSLPQPLPTDWKDGKNKYPFTVGEGKQVYFSQGNLQYNATGSSPTAASGENVGGTWRFAEHQFDFIGADNANVGQAYGGWIDLFGWGTSGNNHGGTCYQPWSTSTTCEEYYAYGDYTGYLYDSNGTADWGANAISNGGNAASSWRTLTPYEWDYLINSRTNAANLYGWGKVGSCTQGLIILPDDWNWEGDVAEFAESWKPGESAWSNAYSYSEWAKMEAAGAVFLPAAGYRDGTSVNEVGSEGRYWSSECFDASDSASSLEFDEDGSEYGDEEVDADCSRHRSDGFSVRLVSDDPPVGR